MVIETLATNAYLLIGLSLLLFYLIDTNFIPKFKFRRRIFSGIIGGFLFQAFLLLFGNMFGVTMPSVESLKMVLIAATVGSMIKQFVDSEVS